MLRTNLLCLILFFIAFCSISAHSAQVEYAGLIPPEIKAWGVTDWTCEDGSRARFCSTLPAGETRTGVLRSREFDCPAVLAFYLAGHSRQNRNFIRLVDAATLEVYRSEPVPGSDAAKRFEWDLSKLAGKRVRLQVEDGDAGEGWAWIAFGRLQPEVVAVPKSGDRLPGSDWTEAQIPSEKVLVDGVPFMKTSPWLSSKEGDALDISLDIEAKYLYLLGCTNRPDTSNPGWGGGKSFDCFFLGDSAGDLIIKYKSGVSDTVPLVFGYTIWWREPYNAAPAPFASDSAKRSLLDKALCVANGIDGGDRPYFLRIALRREPVASIAFRDNAGKLGSASIEGVSFEIAGRDEPLDANRYTRLAGTDVPEKVAAWLREHTVESGDPFPEKRRIALKSVARLLYTHPDDISARTLKSVRPQVNATNYLGPKVRFEGPPSATLLTNVYYENSNEILTRVDDGGMVHESGKGADYYCGFGGWRPGLGAFYGDSYTRLRALTLLSHAGFSDKVEKSIDFFDKWLMYYPRSFPQVQLGGRPVPGHASVIANKPHVYFDVIRWGTKYKTRDFGNPENDGHGMLMLTRWRAWVKGGRAKGWVDKHWEALNEAAEYIPWCLDNPGLSFSEHGLLYNESEGGLRKASMFCDFPCYLGLLAYAEMADASGRHDKGRRWREQAQRFFGAMAPYYRTTVAARGDVWDPDKSAGWGPSHATLAPVILGMDYLGLDVAQRLPAGWLGTTERTYDMQIVKNQPQWCAPTGLGYGQCYITEAALLLDRMNDARGLVEWMARFCFAPRLPHPYRAPEGAAIASDRSVWRRWGDLGNLYQMAEVVYTTHVMIGIDDLDPKCVKLMSRLPIGWTGMDVRDWPVRATCGGRSVSTKLAMKLSRDAKGRRLDLSIQTGRVVDVLRARLGPFPKNLAGVRVTVNGKRLKAALQGIGDSKWAWIELGGGNTKYEIRADAN